MNKMQRWVNNELTNERRTNYAHSNQNKIDINKGKHQKKSSIKFTKHYQSFYIIVREYH
jgi:hypothetical protein